MALLNKKVFMILVDECIRSIETLAKSFDSQIHCKVYLYVDYTLVDLHYTAASKESFILLTIADLQPLIEKAWMYLCAP